MPQADHHSPSSLHMPLAAAFPSLIPYWHPFYSTGKRPPRLEIGDIYTEMKGGWFGAQGMP